MLDKDTLPWGILLLPILLADTSRKGKVRPGNLRGSSMSWREAHIGSDRPFCFSCGLVLTITSLISLASCTNLIFLNTSSQFSATPHHKPNSCLVSRLHHSLTSYLPPQLPQLGFLGQEFPTIPSPFPTPQSNVRSDTQCKHLIRAVFSLSQSLCSFCFVPFAFELGCFLC